jgi:hypothetical protein
VHASCRRGSVRCRCSSSFPSWIALCVAGLALSILPAQLPDLDRTVVPTSDRETSRREFVKNRFELCFGLCDAHRFSQLLDLISRFRLPDKDIDQLAVIGLPLAVLA